MYRIEVKENPRGEGRGHERPPLPFIKGYGELRPAAGNELRVKTLRQLRGGNIVESGTLLAQSDVYLPFKIEPNWRLSLAPVSEAFGGLKRTSVTLKTKLFPGGLVTHAISMSLVASSDFSPEQLVSGTKMLLDGPSLELRRKSQTQEVSVSDCFEGAHKTIVNSLCEEPSSQDLGLSKPHRIMMPMGPSSGLDFKKHRTQLAALIGLLTDSTDLSEEYISDRLRGRLAGIKQKQFLLFHPACTIIYPDIPPDVKSNLRYVQSCFRENFSDIVALGLLQRYFLDRVLSLFEEFERMVTASPEEQANIRNVVRRLTHIPLYQADWVLDRLDGGHAKFFRIVMKSLSIERATREVRARLEALLLTRMDSQDAIETIESGLKLVDDFRELIFRLRGQSGRRSGQVERVSDGLVIRSQGSEAKVTSAELKLDEWDRTQYEALERRVRGYWQLFHELFSQLPLLSVDESARIKLRMNEIQSHLCEDFKEMVRIYQRALGLPLPSHYALYEVCGESQSC